MFCVYVCMRARECLCVCVCVFMHIHFCVFNFLHLSYISVIIMLDLDQIASVPGPIPTILKVVSSSRNL